MPILLLAALLGSIASSSFASSVDSLVPLPSVRPLDAEAGLRLTPDAISIDPIGGIWILDRARGRILALGSDSGGVSFGVRGEDQSGSSPIADLAASGTYLFALEPPTPSVALLDLDGLFRERVDLSDEMDRAGWRGVLLSRLLIDRSGELWLFAESQGVVLHLDRRGIFLDAPYEAVSRTERPERISDVALGPDDALFLLDSGGQRIYRLSSRGVPEGAITIPSSPIEPTSLAVDRSGRLYLLESSGRIRILADGGRILYDGRPPGPVPSGPHRAAVTREGILMRTDPASGMIHRWRVVGSGSGDAKP